jgi:alkylated DNA repair dioxygenase AlkB
MLAVMPRLPAAAAPPPGFSYRRDFITAEEERAIVSGLEQLAFQNVEMRGQVARRTVVHFGWDYDYEKFTVQRTAEPPELLRPLIARCEEAAEVESGALEQILIGRYPPGATIGWHRDAPMFGVPVVGVSLAGHCVMRLRNEHEVWNQLLEPRSVYIIGGPARTQWQHSIPPTKMLRYSVTMRVLKKGWKR